MDGQAEEDMEDGGQHRDYDLVGPQGPEADPGALPSLLRALCG